MIWSSCDFIETVHNFSFFGIPTSVIAVCWEPYALLRTILTFKLRPLADLGQCWLQLPLYLFLNLPFPWTSISTGLATTLAERFLAEPFLQSRLSSALIYVDLLSNQTKCSPDNFNWLMVNLLNLIRYLGDILFLMMSWSLPHRQAAPEEVDGYLSWDRFQETPMETTTDDVYLYPRELRDQPSNLKKY